MSGPSLDNSIEETALGGYVISEVKNRLDVILIASGREVTLAMKLKQELLKSYINRLTKQDIVNYLSKECIPASDKEIDLIYNAIKNDYDEILDSNFISYISKYELNFNKHLYQKIIEKYNEYKKFIE